MFAVLPPINIASPAYRVPACKSPVYRGPIHRHSTYKRCINTALNQEPNPPALVRTVGTPDLFQIQLFKQKRHFGSCSFDSYEIKYALDNFGQLTLLVQSKLDDFSKVFTFEKHDRVDPTHISFEYVSQGLLITLPRSSRRVIVSGTHEGPHIISVSIKQCPQSQSDRIDEEEAIQSDQDDMESDEGDVTIDDGDDKESNESSTENLPNDNNLIEVQIEEAGDSTHEAAEPLSVREISVTVEEPETEIVVKEPASIPNVETPAPSQRKKLRSPRLEVVEDDGL